MNNNIWYQVTKGVGNARFTIKVVEIERETKCSVWIENIAFRKHDRFYNFFETKKEAENFCEETHKENIEFWERKIKRAQNYIEKTKTIKLFEYKK